MAHIEYISGNEELLDLIEPLWQGLNEHHKKLSPYFKPEYEKFIFQDRKIPLQAKAAEGLLRVELARDVNTGAYVAYCISSAEQGQGEIESIYVKSEYRSLGIGDCLMKRALSWMDEMEIKVKTVNVAVGNEAAFSFYERFGFLPRLTLLKQR